MPRRATACGGRPLIVLPANSTWPAGGGSSPVIRSKRVVWPAPLGPMIARRSRASTSSDTPLSAASAPKRRVSAWHRRRGALTRLPSSCLPARQPEEPLRRPQDEADEGDAQDQRPVLGV